MNDRPNTQQKALEINLDASRYGSFAEIGAGQEVARWFFRAGRAAGTVAKTISAYDMQVSDAIYGRATRYVSRERLDSMLDHEFALAVERLDGRRGLETAFFAFADTVATQRQRGDAECHAWMGIRFQAQPRDEHSEVVLHARMRDRDALMQHEALGILGVNLIYGASRLSSKPEDLLASLVDDLGQRIEIDMIEFSGIEFRRVDNRVMSMRLVERGLSKAAMFAPTGQVLQPAEVLHRRPVLLQRGRFRPPTIVNADIQRRALEQFSRDSRVDADQVVPIVEMSLQELRGAEGLCVADFIDRIEALSASDDAILISAYADYHLVAEYLASHTSAPIGLALGVDSFQEMLKESAHEDLDGGILEAMGRLFRRQVQIFVYPAVDRRSGVRIDPDRLVVDWPLAKLVEYIRERGSIVPLQGLDNEQLRIRPDDVVAGIRGGQAGWEDLVEPGVAAAIKEGCLFGYGGGPVRADGEASSGRSSR